MNILGLRFSESPQRTLETVIEIDHDPKDIQSKKIQRRNLMYKIVGGAVISGFLAAGGYARLEYVCTPRCEPVKGSSDVKQVTMIVPKGDVKSFFFDVRTKEVVRKGEAEVYMNNKSQKELLEIAEKIGLKYCK